MKVVTKADQALQNISRLQDELSNSPELVNRLGFVHAWYVDARDAENPLFGFSKFIGYQGLTADKYIAKHQELDGRNTEWVLKDFFDELRPGTPDFRHYHERLTEWLGGLGKTPRKTVRLMVLKPAFHEEATTEDKRLLDLLVAAADLLPLSQRQELRARL
jgi:hypothetical protein